jgi:transposase
VFEGILYALHTGCQWKVFTKSDFGSTSAVHKYFLEWQATGLFEQLWHASLLEYDKLEGIAWEYPKGINGKAWTGRWSRHRWRWSR